MVRKIKAKLVSQLRAEGLSGRAIAASQQISRNSVAAVLEAADAAKLSWDDVADLPDGEVYSLLFPGRGEHDSVFAEPDWAEVHREMARVGVTMKLLHGEYTDRCASSGSPAMGYDRFCKQYQQHVQVAGLASRVGHKAGQTVEVDWSGPTMHLTESRHWRGEAGVSVRWVPAVLPLRLRRTYPGHEAGHLAARSRGDVRVLRRLGPADRAGQSQDRRDHPSP